jgi:hypothetical protein
MTQSTLKIALVLAMFAGFAQMAPAQTAPTNLSVGPICAVQFFGTFRSKKADAKAGITRVVRAENMVNDDHYAELQTTQIPMALGTMFGMVRTLSNIKDAKDVQLVISHPQMIDLKGQASVRTVVNSPVINRGDIYRFDLPYALVPGAWKFDYQLNGKSLCAQDFTIG